MEPRTETINAKSWIEANKGIKITAYIENYASMLSVWKKPLLNENLNELSRETSVMVLEKQPTVAEPELDLELQAWDALSDEALMSFEQELS
jgi:hypothetical protein